MMPPRGGSVQFQVPRDGQPHFLHPQNIVNGCTQIGRQQACDPIEDNHAAAAAAAEAQDGRKGTVSETTQLKVTQPNQDQPGGT
jgi:hypothetical protein